jgi:hypothetical protein
MIEYRLEERGIGSASSVTAGICSVGASDTGSTP